ncbi:uncharacterized protein BT62DRAFT_923589 [Guyanagaster necrorhizus]|uniref:Uncharacterized protein n=1 Tax=Guyanagaster necrorhizus TaxID=856835 RepID=A0A9P7VH88_9AGAR|nr:uncharacterized protein BT62DRAFT_923589 [Guyanagaster necrorhizus MCA 3950]KAG7440998.1 hypothetical protein BT62DRAFT_923589 [Guyanagaster necrorhizus MCA 3950]
MQMNQGREEVFKKRHSANLRTRGEEHMLSAQMATAINPTWENRKLEDPPRRQPDELENGRESRDLRSFPPRCLQIISFHTDGMASFVDDDELTGGVYTSLASSIISALGPLKVLFFFAKGTPSRLSSFPFRNEHTPKASEWYSYPVTPNAARKVFWKFSRTDL